VLVWYRGGTVDGMKNFTPRISTQRCILRRGHLGDCDWNNFDPPAVLDQCRGKLVQLEGGERDGEWVPLRTVAA
jgi:hypothetical protein